MRGHALEAVQVIDMPLLFETKSEWLFREIVVVTCEHEKQLERLCHRDDISQDAALTRIRAQIPQAYKAAHASILIDNSGSITDTRQQVCTHGS
jgi:dephospho-CoA kinase